jgi:hypothetical protein
MTLYVCGRIDTRTIPVKLNPLFRNDQGIFFKPINPQPSEIPTAFASADWVLPAR